MRGALKNGELELQYQAQVNLLNGNLAANTAIVTAIVTLSGQIGLSTEGIEDAACEMKLKLLGCEKGQGNLYGKPMRADGVNAMLAAKAQAAA